MRSIIDSLGNALRLISEREKELRFTTGYDAHVASIERSFRAKFASIISSAGYRARDILGEVERAGIQGELVNDLSDLIRKLANVEKFNFKTLRDAETEINRLIEFSKSLRQKFLHSGKVLKVGGIEI